MGKEICDIVAELMREGLKQSIGSSVDMEQIRKTVRARLSDISGVSGSSILLEISGNSLVPGNLYTSLLMAGKHPPSDIGDKWEDLQNEYEWDGKNTWVKTKAPGIALFPFQAYEKEQVMNNESKLFRTVESEDRKGRPCIKLRPYGEDGYSINLTVAKLIAVHRSAIEDFVVKHIGDAEPQVAKNLFEVWAIIEDRDPDEEVREAKAGVACRNRDGSINIYLDVLPISGRLCIRDMNLKGETNDA